MTDQVFGAMSQSKKRDIFRAWITGRCEYWSNSGEWLRLDPPSTENAAYLGATKIYRIANPEGQA